MGTIVHICYNFKLNNKEYEKFGQGVAEVSKEEDIACFNETELKQMALYNEFSSEIDEDKTLLDTLLKQAKFEFVEVC